jgi:prephenate dehydrogenase
MRIAVIGAGRMGKWFTKFFLEQGFKVVVSDKDWKKLQRLREELNVEIADNVKAVESADRILVCVPIDNFEDVIREISVHIKPGHEVMDICSVKEHPVNIMHKYISNAVTLGTHPMFGPGAKSVKGQNFILTPTNAKEQTLARDFGKWLESKGANVLFMTPKEHDKIMSIVIGLPLFLCHVVCDTLLSSGEFEKAKDVSGVSYRLLLKLIEAVVSEETELSASVQMNLPDLNDIGKLLSKKIGEWLDILRRKNKTELVKKITILKSELAKVDPHYSKAYKYMYKMLEVVNGEC